jgi:hypothetical protein
VTFPLYHDLVKILISILTQVQNHQLHLTQNSSKYLTTPIQHYDIEVSPYQDHEEGGEGKIRSWREDKELKAKQEVEEKTRSWSQKKKIKRREPQVKKMKVLDLMT